MFVACGQNSSQKEKTVSTKLAYVRDSLDTYFTKLTELRKFNGVVLAYKNDTLLLDKAYNLSAQPNNMAYVTTNHQFDIHSVSKLMTYYLVAQLELEGKLSIDQTLDTYFDGFSKGNEITLKMLLEHKSGLPRELIGFEGEEYLLTLDEILELSTEQKLLFQPGADVQ